jgi:glutathione peroxidase-family protein
MEIGDSLFNFKLPGTDDRKYSNHSYADRYALLILVTCNHCPYSRSYWKRIEKLYKRYNEDNLGIMMINANDSSKYPQDSFENMQKLMENKFAENFVYLHDEKQDVVKRLGAQRTPEAFLFNSKRELTYKGAFDDNWENANMVTRVYLEDAIESTLDGLEVDFPEIPAVGCSIKWKS